MTMLLLILGLVESMLLGCRVIYPCLALTGFKQVVPGHIINTNIQRTQKLRAKAGKRLNISLESVALHQRCEYMRHHDVTSFSP